MSSKKYVIKLNRDLCIGAASCLALAPKTFELDFENKVCLSAVSEDDNDAITLAAESCPTKAITLIDAETGEHQYP